MLGNIIRRSHAFDGLLSYQELKWQPWREKATALHSVSRPDLWVCCSSLASLGAARRIDMAAKNWVKLLLGINLQYGDPYMGSPSALP